MKYIVLSILSFLTIINTFADIPTLPIQSHSPLIDKGPWGIEIPLKISPIQIRVLIFPHTLKKDYRHGIPDNPHGLKILSEDSINSKKGLLGKELSFFINEKNKLIMKGNGFERKIDEGSIYLTSNKPLALFRENNPKKTHQYIGKLEIRANKKSIFVINHLSLEDYIRGVVPNEVVKTWPIDVLKAQAVAARTYAVYHTLMDKKLSFWDVDDTARYQVFTGISHAVDKTNLSVKETRNEIMTFKGRVIKAYFHSYSGGKTSSAKRIFGDSNNEYCIGIEEIFSRQELLNVLNPKFSWIVKWTTPKIKKANFLSFLKKNKSLKARFNHFDERIKIRLETEKDQDFQSLKKLWIIQKEKKEYLNFKDIRFLFGYGKIHSYWFYLKNNNEESFEFNGHGWGHHVGMSQWGAYIMANNYGFEYKDILKHYYNGISFQEFF